MDKGRLTQRQNEAYEFIRRYVEENRKPPTLKEIGAALGISSTNGVYKLLQALEKKGYVEREKHAARGLRLVDEPRDPFGFDGGPPRLPLLGRVSSADPDRLRERPRTTLSVDEALLRSARSPDACVAARASDDGMNGAGIHKGDVLLIEEMDWADLRNGTTAAFLVGEQILAREFHYANGRLHLRPADRHYSEDTFPTDTPECYVVGRVLGVIRILN